MCINEAFTESPSLIVRFGFAGVKGYSIFFLISASSSSLRPTSLFHFVKSLEFKSPFEQAESTEFTQINWVKTKRKHRRIGFLNYPEGNIGISDASNRIYYTEKLNIRCG